MYDARVFATIHTVPGGRDGVFDRTLRQLRAAGVSPTVFTTEGVPAGKLNSVMTKQKVLAAFLASPAQFCLFLEDDLDVGRDFKRVLDDVAETYEWEVFTFFLAETAFLSPEMTRAVRNGDKIKPGFYPVVNASKWWGAQACWFSRRVGLELVPYLEGQRGIAEKRNHSGNIDTGIARVCARHGFEITTYHPNPVQHFGATVKSAVSPRAGCQQQSLTFRG
jgi:hypothetical protein